MLRSTRAPSAPLHPTWAWILGLAAGFIGTWIAILARIPGVAICALVAIGLVLRGPRAAFGGAMLFMTGLWSRTSTLRCSRDARPRTRAAARAR